MNGIDLDIRPGEIVGLGGLDGQGQRQLLLGLFGTLIGTSGKVEVGGSPVRLSSPKRAKSDEVGMALIPEDRKNEGLMLPMTVRENLSFAAVEQVSRFGVVDLAAEKRAIDKMVDLLKIKSDGIDGPVGSLSGGNQQKIVIGKWLMTKPRIILLNDPTRGIDVGTKQEIYQLLQKLASEGAAILFYSTDYDELIGCCDRVLVMYGGAVVRTLEGDQLNETNLVSAALNLPVPADEVPGPLRRRRRHYERPRRSRRNGSRAAPMLQLRLSAAQRGVLIAVAIFAAMFAVYGWKQPVGLTSNVINTASNKGALLALVAMAQTLPVLTGGLDLSVGAIFVLSNCLASSIVVGDPLSTAVGVVTVLLTGTLCGATNGIIIVYGRLQPLIVTLAMGAVYFGIALALRPQPGGSVNFELADFATRSTYAVPHSAVLLLLVVLLIWIPYRRSVLGRAALPSVRPNRPPTCPACRSHGRRSSPSPCPVFWRRSADCC
ncbi:ATP-binding cassette domain-containing protein [Novosphingobium sp. MW5]|nr:ATP-binding cassette domain-containing protein [Novosphingobium sp. MW5]